jgi:TM2 domain-containing membrane protein YozV
MASPANPTATSEPKVRCPYCSELVAFSAKKCKHCGEFFDPQMRQSRMPLQQRWNPGTAAVLSLVIPGAGQMYKGQIGPGIWWLVGTVAGYCAFVVPGLVLHIICIYKAYSDDPTKASGSRRRFL